MVISVLFRPEIVFVNRGKKATKKAHIRVAICELSTQIVNKWGDCNNRSHLKNNSNRHHGALDKFREVENNC